MWRKRLLLQTQSWDTMSSLLFLSPFLSPAAYLGPHCLLRALDPVPLQLSGPGGAAIPSLIVTWLADCGACLWRGHVGQVSRSLALSAGP